MSNHSFAFSTDSDSITSGKESLYAEKTNKRRQHRKKLEKADRNFYTQRAGLERALIHCEQVLEARQHRDHVIQKIQIMMARCRHPKTWYYQGIHYCERCGFPFIQGVR